MTKITDLNFERLHDEIPRTVELYTAGLACVFAQDTSARFDLSTHDMLTLALTVGIEAENRRLARTGDFYSCAFVEAAAVCFNRVTDPPTLEQLFDAGQAEVDALNA